MGMHPACATVFPLKSSEYGLGLKAVSKASPAPEPTCRQHSSSIIAIMHTRIQFDLN
jgi:hypothetical protein